MPRGTTHAVGVECTNCGLTSGHAEAGGDVRCDECGRFAERSGDYCGKHGVNVRKLNGRDKCPKCRRERDVRQREQELQARSADPNMHNMVDAQANAIDHSRSPGDFM